MTPKQFYYEFSKEEVERVAVEASTTFSNFRQIALAGGACGKRLAERLRVASGGRITELEALYPERYEGDGEAA